MADDQVANGLLSLILGVGASMNSTVKTMTKWNAEQYLGVSKDALPGAGVTRTSRAPIIVEQGTCGLVRPPARPADKHSDIEIQSN
jgi:hypothetical protein